MQKALKEHNTELEVGLLNGNHVYLRTTQLEKGRGKLRAAVVVCSYCPVCGEKLNVEESPFKELKVPK